MLSVPVSQTGHYDPSSQFKIPESQNWDTVWTGQKDAIYALHEPALEDHLETSNLSRISSMNSDRHASVCPCLSMPIFCELHWLPFCFQVSLKCCSFFDSCKLPRIFGSWASYKFNIIVVTESIKCLDWIWHFCLLMKSLKMPNNNNITNIFVSTRYCCF